MVTRTAKLAAVAVGLCAVVLGLSVQPSWAEDAFAKITVGNVVIPGDQPEIKGLPGSKGAVQVFSTAFGLANTLTFGGGGGAGGGKAVPTPVAVVKRFDPASPRLLKAAFLGEALTVEITWYMNFQNVPRKTVTIKLEDAFISNMEASAELQGANASGFETVSFIYSRITFSTPIIDPATGAVTGTSSVCLDVVNLKTC